MKLFLYPEHLNEQGKTKQLADIGRGDFLPDVQDLILHVLSLHGQVTYYNHFNGYNAVR